MKVHVGGRAFVGQLANGDGKPDEDRGSQGKMRVTRAGLANGRTPSTSGFLGKLSVYPKGCQDFPILTCPCMDRAPIFQTAAITNLACAHLEGLS